MNDQKIKSLVLIIKKLKALPLVKVTDKHLIKRVQSVCNSVDTIRNFK